MKPEQEIGSSLSSSMASSSAVQTASLGGRLRRLWYRWRAYGGWIGAVLAMFFFFAWLSLPTEAIAWRIGYEARKHGYDIEVEDVSVSPFGGVTLENVRWTFEPSRPGEVPLPFVVETVEVDFSLLRWFFGTTAVQIVAAIDDGVVEAEYVADEEFASLALDIRDLPVYSLPKVRQWFSAPMHGLVNVTARLDLPETMYSKANGTIELSCTDWRVGDGESLLYVPWSRGLLAKGVTIPEIELGALEGKLVVEDGVVRTETPISTTSDDLTAELSGTIQLKDPILQSSVNLVFMVQIAERLQEKSDSIRLMVQTAHPTSRLEPPQQGLGFRLRGPLLRPKFTGINAKSSQDRIREQRRRARERARRVRQRQQATKARNDAKEPAEEEPAEEERDMVVEDDERDDGIMFDDERERVAPPRAREEEVEELPPQPLEEPEVEPVAPEPMPPPQPVGPDDLQGGGTDNEEPFDPRSQAPGSGDTSDGGGGSGGTGGE